MREGRRDGMNKEWNGMKVKDEEWVEKKEKDE